jgi:hypothetical protein
MCVVEMVDIICFKCGVPYTTPVVFFNSKRKFSKPIHCPNGHKNQFKSDEDLKADGDAAEALLKANEALRLCRQELTQQKEEMVSLRHRAEMAEAKAGTKPPEASISPPASEAPDGRPVIRQKHGRMCCPHCDATYKTMYPFRKHLRFEHNEEALSRALRDLCQVRFVDAEAPAAGGAA